jgi:hypothetical protein
MKPYCARCQQEGLHVSCDAVEWHATPSAMPSILDLPRFGQASSELLWKVAELDLYGHGPAAMAELERREDDAAAQRDRTRRTFPWRLED